MFFSTDYNPLSPTRDQHQISPCNINAYSTPKVWGQDRRICSLILEVKGLTQSNRVFETHICHNLSNFHANLGDFLTTSTRGFNKSRQLAKFGVYVKQIDLNSPPTFSKINNTRVKIEVPLVAYFAVFAVCLQTY